MTQTATVVQRTIQTKHRENGLAQTMRKVLGDLTQLPPYEQAPELYTDWGEEGEFKVQVGRGECAQ